MKGFTLEDEADLLGLLSRLLQAEGPDVTDDRGTAALSPHQLLARIESLFPLSRTKAAGPAASLQFGDLRIDPATREVEAGSQLVDLTAKEFHLLTFLASSPRQVFSRQQLLEHVWSSCREWQDEATVTEHVRRVRQKIEVDPSKPQRISTVRGVGYKFVPPVEARDLAATVAISLPPRRAAQPGCVSTPGEHPSSRRRVKRRREGSC